MGSGAEERRAHPRVRTRRRVSLALSDGRRVMLWSHDFSRGGLQLLSDSAADVDDCFRLGMSALEPSTGEYVQIELRARVARLVYDGGAGQFRIGFQIVEFFGGAEPVYGRYVDYLLERSRRLR
jgi:hypothetical protein